ncbi:MAG: polysaccharide biosynthesis protein [Candidatus Harrisonbacteria bacterium]|nr:polysaccharide biosynthesis protein [Candidatus Harrisonbacteria bacterium]
MKNQFEGKTILVTGGTGSIGLEIVRQLLKYNPKAIRIFARHEDRHYHLMHDFGLGNSTLRFIVGDVRDKDRLRMAMDGVDIVFHAAALKQVPICEYNPFEAVKTNIIGVQNVIEAAREENVEQVIGISTDKVAEPQGVLGVSKLMAEKLFLATYYYGGGKRTKFSCVRFGNVLGSRGSLLPLLRKQIFGNKEITITAPDMTRFVMTIPQAVNLVLRAANLSQGQEIFILKMPSVRLGDLIDAAVHYYAPLAGKKKEDVKIKVIGARDGEKFHEQLLANHEVDKVLETEDMYILTPHEKVNNREYAKVYPSTVKGVKGIQFSSEHAPKLDLSELLRLVEEADLHQV